MTEEIFDAAACASEAGAERKSGVAVEREDVVSERRESLVERGEHCLTGFSGHTRAYPDVVAAYFYRVVSGRDAVGHVGFRKVSVDHGGYLCE